MKRQLSTHLRAQLIYTPNDLPARLSASDFEALIDTGDLLFFKSATLGGRVQRFMTNSDFDHVGLALKYRKPIPNDATGQYIVKLYVLEATGVNVRFSVFDVTFRGSICSLGINL